MNQVTSLILSAVQGINLHTALPGDEGKRGEGVCDWIISPTQRTIPVLAQYGSLSQKLEFWQLDLTLGHPEPLLYEYRTRADNSNGGKHNTKKNPVFQPSAKTNKKGEKNTTDRR